MQFVDKQLHRNNFFSLFYGHIANKSVNKIIYLYCIIYVT